jgi:hypothetical protein
MRLIPASLTACAVAGLILILPVSGTAQAQDSRWFRVELLVFANQSAPAAPSGAASAEQWDPTPALAYPDAARFLVDPRQVEANRAEFQGDSRVDELGRQIITIRTEATAPAANTDIPVPAPLRPVSSPEDVPPGTAAPAPVPDEPSAMAASADPARLPTPFVLLPDTTREFRAKAAQMQRSGRYAVLFHETWVQPVSPESNSLPIILDRSGDTQMWPRLQGSIKLHLSRYLHLESELWLNTNGDYLPGEWRMPAPPLGPPSLVIEEVQPVGFDAPADGDAPAVVPGLAESPPADAGSAGDAAVPTDPVTGELDASGAAELPVVTGPVYPFRHAVLLQEKRRMRSAEIHYIDHPLMGIIVKFTPVTADELAAIAATENTLSAQPL